MCEHLRKEDFDDARQICQSRSDHADQGSSVIACEETFFAARLLSRVGLFLQSEVQSDDE